MAFNKEQFIEDLKAMSVLELKEVVEAIEETFGVSAQPVAVAGAAAGAAAESAAGVAAESVAAESLAVESLAEESTAVVSVVAGASALLPQEAKEIAARATNMKTNFFIVF